MSANMRCEKSSLALLSSKRPKIFWKDRADNAFALNTCLDAQAPTITSAESTCRSASGKFKLNSKAGHQVIDIELLKKTMLGHESMFREQLFELHRLYNVQNLLMEELKKRRLPCEESRDESRLINSEQFSFLSHQTDVNNPCVDRLTISNTNSQSPMIDLEQSAEEQTQGEVVNEGKPIVRNSFLGAVENSQPLPCTSWQDLQCRFLPCTNASMVMSETMSSNMCRVEKTTVPIFPLESSIFSKASMGDKSDRASDKINPVTSLFGVDLRREVNNSRQAPLSESLSRLGDKINEFQFVGSDRHESSNFQVSKLPHWLIQDVQTTNMPPSINSAHTLLHHTSSTVWQRHDDEMPYFDGRLSCAEHEHSLAQSRHGRFKIGRTSSKANHCNASLSEYSIDPIMSNAHGPHENSQGNSLDNSNLSLPLLSFEGSQITSGASAINRSSPPFEASTCKTDAASSALLMKELSSNLKSCVSSVYPWYHQRFPTSVLSPQVSKPDAHNQRASNEFTRSPSSWVNVAAHEEVLEGASANRGQESSKGNVQGGNCSPPLQDIKQRFPSKRLMFGFMPMAANLDLTLGLDLHDNECMERTQRNDESFLSKHFPQRQNNSGLQSKAVRNDFDLNEQSGQVTDREGPTMSASFQQKFVNIVGIEGGMSTVVKTPYIEQQGSFNGSNLKAIPEETTASTITLKEHSMESSVQIYRYIDAPDEGESYAAGTCGSLFSGKSNDSSGLMSCQSRSLPIPTNKKCIDNSSLGGEACQSIAVLQPPQAVPFECSCQVLGRRHEAFSAMHSCSEVNHCRSPKRFLLTDNCVSNNTCDSRNDDKDVKDNAEASEIADILLLLSLDLPPLPLVLRKCQGAKGHEEQGLRQLADTIPQYDMQGVDAEIIASSLEECSDSKGADLYPKMIGRGVKVPDSFELAVLSMKPVDPGSETLCVEPIERCDLAEDCLLPFNLRRRSLRRGRSGKDFQKEMLPNIASLSRQEIAEDLQIIEGLVKSATEAMARCSVSSKEDLPWSLPPLSSVKMASKGKDLKNYKCRRQNGILGTCSWGALTCRRRRMRRQRRTFLPLGYSTLDSTYDLLNLCSAHSYI